LPIDKKIFGIISNHPKIAPNYANAQTIRQTISNIRTKNAGLSYNAAAHVFAQKHKVSVFRYLDDKDGETLSKYNASTRTSSNNSGKARSRKFEQIIRIGPLGDIKDPVISAKIAKDAKEMANVYPFIYVFENSVRIIVTKVLELKYGKDWWKKAKINRKISDKVKIRKKDEDKNKWHGKRGAHEIYYTDIEELMSIIENNWKFFEPHLPKQHIVKAIIEIIGTSRNVLAHNNPLGKDDILSLKLNYRRWTKQVKDI